MLSLIPTLCEGLVQAIEIHARSIDYILISGRLLDIPEVGSRTEVSRLRPQARRSALKLRLYSDVMDLLVLLLQPSPPSFDVCWPARRLWLFLEHLQVVSSSSGNRVCDMYMLAGLRTCVHRRTFGTKQAGSP